MLEDAKLKQKIKALLGQELSYEEFMAGKYDKAALFKRLVAAQSADGLEDYNEESANAS